MVTEVDHPNVVLTRSVWLKCCHKYLKHKQESITIVHKHVGVLTCPPQDRKRGRVPKIFGVFYEVRLVGKGYLSLFSLLTSIIVT